MTKLLVSLCYSQCSTLIWDTVGTSENEADYPSTKKSRRIGPRLKQLGIFLNCHEKQAAAYPAGATGDINVFLNTAAIHSSTNPNSTPFNHRTRQIMTG
ncbi:hypothetical protein [Burkholderia gladioli]|uniref:hypothetical protein n=1 Tax=Burkholderia gladioli TaxID=28095 RepID=UPI001641D355|nr:hypothetical protein [Burkholderia gladioli]